MLLLWKAFNSGLSLFHEFLVFLILVQSWRSFGSLLRRPLKQVIVL